MIEESWFIDTLSNWQLNKSIQNRHVPIELEPAEIGTRRFEIRLEPIKTRQTGQLKLRGDLY